VRLAIAKGDRSGTALHPRKAHAVTPTTQWEREERASLAGSLVASAG